jgi:hypothetical protein
MTLPCRRSSIVPIHERRGLECVLLVTIISIALSFDTSHSITPIPVDKVSISFGSTMGQPCLWGALCQIRSGSYGERADFGGSDGTVEKCGVRAEEAEACSLRVTQRHDAGPDA